MAIILYGVNGEGAGHSTRSREVIDYLRANGHEVIAATFDRGLENLRSACETVEIQGLRFSYVDNQVRYRRTAAKNVFASPKIAASEFRLVRLIRERKIGLVITDFEPLTCRAARRTRTPLLSIDNQHMMTNTDVKTPREFRKDAAAAKLVTRLMTPGSGNYIITSFFEAEIKKKNTIIVPPILRKKIVESKPTRGEHILVYVTSPAPALAEILRSVRGEFRAYGFGREGTEGNVEFKKPSLDGFAEDLLGSRAVIANAGFSLLTESLYLRKPFLAVPLKHQYEQMFNAYWLAKAGYGTYWEELNKERVESFLYNLSEYEERLSGYPRNGNQRLFAALDKVIPELLGSERKARGQA
jgi:uncharacterized protein (TIGR00661 family)